MSLAILLITLIFDYLLITVLVGITFFALFGRKLKSPYSPKSLYILVGIFALLDLYAWPAYFTSQITFTVHNQQIVEFFELKENMSAGEFFDPGLFDLFIYFLQAGVAYYVGTRVFEKLIGVNQ
jgi:hypothetical protein